MSGFDRIIGRLSALVDGAAAIFLAIITALTFVAVLLRYVFNLPFPGSFDVSRLLLGVAIFWGIAAAAWRNEHIKVDLFWQVLPARAQKAVDLFSDILFSGFIFTFAWMLFRQVEKVRGSGLTTFEMGIPVWPFTAVAWLGILFCALVLAARVLRSLAAFVAPTGDAGR
ncbi:TRAP transporter small permease [Aquibium sp. ELW1220]|uniref:TRAP transporter small permease n=1 Tax=Aquibium sp. ELW1220 TaxID=2976766 RepID=UPI0025AF3530|nr:TRAP transporter small permease [Aquibium sp. ELW1220]MDN2583222.1 TRAP transporter small permease [Aquibium sp. ELW1220]